MESNVNQRVKMLRSYLNLTQTEFAMRINSTFATISRIENGTNEPRKSTLLSMCKEFNINSEWLLNGKGEMLLSEDHKDFKIQTESVSWKDEAFAQLKNHNETLKQEIEWLKNLVNKMANVNFHNVIDLVGISPGNSINGVSAAA